MRLAHLEQSCTLIYGVYISKAWACGSTPSDLSLETSHCYPQLDVRTSSHSRMSSTASSASALESPSTSTTPTPSPFLLTLQIIRLVNAFRNRAKTRARSRSKPERKVHQGSCQGFERQVATRIDKYLCRKAVKLGSLTGPSQPEKDIER